MDGNKIILKFYNNVEPNLKNMSVYALQAHYNAYNDIKTEVREEMDKKENEYDEELHSLYIELKEILKIIDKRIKGENNKQCG